MNSSANWDLHVEPGVLRTSRKLSRNDARKISDVIRLLPVDPYAGDIEKIKGAEDTWRRRVGAYRIFYKLLPREKKILVFYLERRTSATYRH